MSTARLLLAAALPSGVIAGSAEAQPGGGASPSESTAKRKPARPAARKKARTKVVPTTVPISASGLIEAGDDPPPSLGRASKGIDLAARDRPVTARVREAPADDVGLSEAEVKKVIRERRDEVDLCHARVAERGGAPREVAVEFLIDPSGAVSRVKADADGPNSTRLEQCMVRAVKRWKFRATAAATPMEVPFVFSDVTAVE